ncbi:response regulator [Ureibacillus chungkukjangi]|uniref:response regulator n=1 Tax=Ureibacillus chungkukjangi TaxID=1202712 RepID=UPI0032E7FE6C
MMPEMDGWEVCKAIREFSNVPIIMLTARTDKSDLVKGLNNGKRKSEISITMIIL